MTREEALETARRRFDELAALVDILREWQDQGDTADGALSGIARLARAASDEVTAHLCK